MASGEGTGPCVCAQQPFFEVMPTPNSTLEGAGHIHHEFSELEKVASAYTEVHGVLSLLVCALGIPMNVLNVFVLTRPHMRTPVNSILTWLAVFDLLTMASYVPFSLHFYCLSAPWELSPERNSLGWMTFLMVHVDFTATTHTISNWLGVTLAVFRYKHIFLPAKGHLTRIRRLVRARIAVFVVIVLSVIVMIPNYIMNRLMPIVFTDATNVTSMAFVIQPLNLGTPHVKPLAQFNLWLHSVVAKLLPCILMVVYSGLLLKTLRTNVRMFSRSSANLTLDCPVVSVKTDGNGSYSHHQIENEINGNFERLITNEGIIHQQLCEPSHDSRSGSIATDVSALCPNCCHNEISRQASSSSSSSPPPVTQRNMMATIKSRRPQDNARTTRMLLAVIILFVVSELPQAILIVLSASLPDFFTNVYMPLGDMMDMLALLNNGINFLLYCIMSRDFRKTLVSLFDSRDCRLFGSNTFKRIKLNGSPIPLDQNPRHGCDDRCSNANLINVTRINGSVS